MSSAKKSVIDKDIIGLDEFHNGFHLNCKGIDFPFLVGGYLIRDYSGSQPNNCEYESKRNVRAFSPSGTRISDSDLIRRSTGYFKTHQDFLYTLLTKKELESQTNASLRGKTNARIIIQFLIDYSLAPKKLAIVLDQVGGNKQSSDEVIYWTNAYLEIKGVQDIPIIAKPKADKYNQAVKIADRMLYYIAAVKFRFPDKKWPLRRKKKLSVKDFERIPSLEDEVQTLEEDMSR